jgi:lipoyl-dependent peroxiredoxin
MALAERTARAVWEGTLTEGGGRVSAESSRLFTDAPVTWAARTEEPGGKTSPEELLAAAHAACYAMAFSNTLAKAGHPAERLEVTATASLDRKPEGGVRVSAMDLHVSGRVPGLDTAGFEAAAATAEEGCPISNAIRGNVGIRLRAELETA